MNLSPQKTRMLEALLIKPQTSRELMIEVGCNNPADTVQHLRKLHNISIRCDMIPFTNRDNKIIQIGQYSILEFEKEKAERLLNGAVTPFNNSVNHLAKQTTDEAIVPQ